MELNKMSSIEIFNQYYVNFINKKRYGAIEFINNSDPTCHYLTYRDGGNKIFLRIRGKKSLSFDVLCEDGYLIRGYKRISLSKLINLAHLGYFDYMTNLLDNILSVYGTKKDLSFNSVYSCNLNLDLVSRNIEKYLNLEKHSIFVSESFQYYNISYNLIVDIVLDVGHINHCLSPGNIVSEFLIDVKKIVITGSYDLENYKFASKIVDAFRAVMYGLPQKVKDNF
jgi:hypothetical protein